MPGQQYRPKRPHCGSEYNETEHYRMSMNPYFQPVPFCPLSFSCLWTRILLVDPGQEWMTRGGRNSIQRRCLLCHKSQQNRSMKNGLKYDLECEQVRMVWRRWIMVKNRTLAKNRTSFVHSVDSTVKCTLRYAHYIWETLWRCIMRNIIDSNLPWLVYLQLTTRQNRTRTSGGKEKNRNIQLLIVRPLLLLCTWEGEEDDPLTRKLHARCV